jgi:hypothetical protein
MEYGSEDIFCPLVQDQYLPYGWCRDWRGLDTLTRCRLDWLIEVKETQKGRSLCLLKGWLGRWLTLIQYTGKKRGRLLACRMKVRIKSHVMWSMYTTSWLYLAATPFCEKSSLVFPSQKRVIVRSPSFYCSSLSSILYSVSCLPYLDC